MVEKITIQPREVRGLGNIVTERTNKDFIGDKCRVQQQTTTVNNVSRKTFSVDGGTSGLTPTYLTVEGPTVVDLGTETLTFTAHLFDATDDTKVTNHTITCVVNGEKYEKSTGSNGDKCVFSIPNDLEEGTYKLTFAYNQIQSHGWSYKNWTLNVVDTDDLELCVLPIRSTIQTDDEDTVISRFRSGLSGIKGKLIYFFERYIIGNLRLYLSKDIIQTGDEDSVSAVYRDEDGGAISDTVIYFFQRYLPSGLRVKLSKQIIQNGDTDTVSAILRDGSGAGIVGEIVYFFERYALYALHLMSDTNTVQKDGYADISVTLKDEDGSAIKGEIVYFYEKYVPTTLTLKSDKSVMQKDDYADLSATLKDKDGSLVQSKWIYFYAKE